MLSVRGVFVTGPHVCGGGGRPTASVLVTRWEAVAKED